MAEDEPREEPPGEDDPDSDLKTLEGLEEAERRINLESAKLQALFAALKRERRPRGVHEPCPEVHPQCPSCPRASHA